MKLANRMQSITASPTLAITSKAKELKAKGLDVISFGAGEPDFDTPVSIKDAAKKALDLGLTKYTPNRGTLDLRKTICDKLQKDNGLKYDPMQVIVSNGAKQSLFIAIMAICNPGDEIIVCCPYWVSYVEQIKLAGGVPVLVSSKEDFSLDMDVIKNSINAKTKAIIINSPCNPTGAVYSKQDLESVAALAIKHDFIVISDEIYEKILYDGSHISIASLGDDIKKQTIVINGVSKSHSMTGWRIGYAAAEKEIIDAMDTIQSHDTSNANSIAQYASVVALNSFEDTDSMVVEFKKRRDVIVGSLNDISDISCQKPKGAFYVFPDVSACFGKNINGKKIVNSIDFCEALLEQKQVAAVPGEAFGDEKCIRLSYALVMDDIQEGINRIKQFVTELV